MYATLSKHYGGNTWDADLSHPEITLKSYAVNGKELSRLLLKDTNSGARVDLAMSAIEAEHIAYAILNELALRTLKLSRLTGKS